MKIGLNSLHEGNRASVGKMNGADEGKNVQGDSEQVC
jgi:hypothetical protein